MAVLEKIRVKFGILISIIIAVALLSFIVDVNTLESAFNVTSKKNHVGEINGKSISYPDFQENVDRLSTINEIITGSSASNEDVQNQIRNTAWQELVYKYLFIKNAKAAGINIGDDEMVALTTGDIISPVIAQDPIFADETGSFSRDAVINLVQSISQDPTGEIRAYWDYVQNTVYTQQFYTKYADLFMQSNFQNALMLKNAVAENNVTTNVDFVMVPLTYANDSSVVVSSDEIKNYYNSHKDFFKQTASRDLEYVVFEVKPSEEDITATNDLITNLYDEFSTTTNMKNFLAKNSDRAYSEYWYKTGELNTINYDVNTFVSENTTGVSPIIRDGNTFYAARVMEVAQRPDSVFVKHILLQDENAKATADSLVNVLNKKGESFSNLAAEFSTDQGSAYDGELGSIGWMTQSYMISGLESVLTAEVNKPFVLNTMYGTHVVLVTEKTKPVTMKRVAVLEKETIASKETINSYYAQANDFLSMAKGGYDNYKAAVESAGVYSHPVNYVTEGTSSYGAIDQAREVTRWAFDNKKGKVSDIITVNNNYFFIVTVKDIHKEGYATVSEVASSIRQQLFTEKYSEKQAAEIAQKIAGLTSLEQIAEKLGTTVSSQEDITFASLTSQGLDPKFIGAVSAAPVGKLCGPLAGSIGVYVYTVTGHDTGAFYTEDDANAYKAQENSYLAQTLLSVMMNDADVKDNRARFY